MRVGFEAKRLFSNFTGLGNYARFVVGALSEFVPQDHYILYTPRVRTHPEIDPIVVRPNVEVISPTGGYKWFKGLWRSWGVSRDTSIDTLSVYHGLSQELPGGLPEKVRKVVTVHDLIYIRYPQFYKPIDVAIYKAKVRAACQTADRIIAISQQTADDLTEFIKVDPKKDRRCLPGLSSCIQTTGIGTGKSADTRKVSAAGNIYSECRNNRAP